MRLMPGALNTTLHPAMVAEGELTRAIRCSRDRGIFELDQCYRQVEPPAEDAVASAFGAYMGTERFLRITDAGAEITTTLTAADFWGRATDGDTSLMDDPFPPPVTPVAAIFQHIDAWYCIGDTGVGTIKIMDGETAELQKNYDPSLYDDLGGVLIEPTTIDYMSWNGATVALDGDDAGAVAVSSDGTIRVTDAAGGAQHDFREYKVTATLAAPETLPTSGYVYLTVVAADDAATFANYSRSNTGDGYNYWNLAGNRVRVRFLEDGGAGVVEYFGRFLLDGQTLYFEAPLGNPAPGFTDFGGVEIYVTLQTDPAGQDFSIGKIGFAGDGLIGTLEDDLEDNGWLGGLGPRFDTDEFLDYALRGSNSDGSVTADSSRLIQVRKDALWSYEHFGNDSTALANTVTLDLSGYVHPGGTTHVQILRKASDGLWYEMDIVTNDGSGEFIDIYPDATVIADFDTVTVDPDPVTSSIEGIVAGTSWKAHLVLADEEGYIYFSKGGDPSFFLWRGYVEGEFGTQIRPRFVQVSSQADPIQALVGMDSLFILTRRRIFWMGGPNAAEAAGPFELQHRGIVGRNAWCEAGRHLLLGCDDGLYAVSVEANITNPGSVSATNLTIERLRASWVELLGDTPENLCLQTADSHIWAFCGSRLMHRNPSGQWCSGEWVTGKSVLNALTDGVGNVVVMFDDGSFAHIGDYPTDGGVEPDGADGVDVEWAARGRQEVLREMPTEVVLQRLDEVEENTSLKVILYGDRTPPEGIELAYNQTTGRSPVPKNDGGIGNRWVQLEIRGGAIDKVTPASTARGPLAIK